MTVASTTSRVDYAGNGSTTAFSVPFYFLANTHLIVYRTDISTGATTTLALTTDYTVIGAGNPSGGTVTCVIAPTSGQRLSVLRNVPLTQEVDYQTNDPFPAATHEAALDKLTMEVQQVNENLGRAVTLSPTSTGVSTTVPTPTANTVLGWDATATSLTNIDPAGWAGTLASEYTYSQTFNGTGAQTAFTLSTAPGAISNTDVYVGGVHQTPTLAYTLSGATVTFTAAPPAGTNNIQIKWNTVMGQAAVQPYATAAAASASAAATSASNASTSATSASTSFTNTQAAIASAVLPITSTSTTSLAIGAGSKSFTTQTGKAWVPGHSIAIVSAANATNSMTGTVTSYNSGTGALVVNVIATGGSGTYADWQMSQATATSLTTKLLRSQFLLSGTTYTPASDVAAFYALVFGATGGMGGANLGGPGGPGYSEKYYPSPTGSYTYALGAGGLNTGTSGGTTTFGGVISVTGSGGTTTTSGGAGGVGSGGDFNATGGTGGAFSSPNCGGAGGAASRAGNGGNGGLGGGASGTGGTGGNNASGTTAGAAAAAVSGSAVSIPWGTEKFYSGNGVGSGAGSLGASILYGSNAVLLNAPLPSNGNNGLVSAPGFPTAQTGFGNAGAATAGSQAVIVIIEVLK